jgi:hypothetical protein
MISKKYWDQVNNQVLISEGCTHEAVDVANFKNSIHWGVVWDEHSCDFGDWSVFFTPSLSEWGMLTVLYRPVKAGWVHLGVGNYRFLRNSVLDDC